MTGPSGLGLIPRTGPLRAPATTAARPVVELLPRRGWLFGAGPIPIDQTGAFYMQTAGRSIVSANSGNTATLTSDPIDIPGAGRLVAVARAGRANHTTAFSWSFTDSGGGTWTVDSQGPDPGSNLFGRKQAISHVDLAGAASGLTVTVDPWATADIGAIGLALIFLPAGSYNTGGYLAQTPGYSSAPGGNTATAAMAGAATGAVYAVSWAEDDLGTVTWDAPEAGFQPIAQTVTTYYNGRVTVAAGDTDGATTISYVGGSANTADAAVFEIAPASGGPVPISLTGASTSAGALTRQARRSLAGTVTSAGALTRQARRSLPIGGANLTSAGVLTRRAGKALTGSAASSGALVTVKAILRTFTAALTSSGALTRQDNKALTGSTTSTGTPTRQASKALTGVMANTGALATVKAILLTFTGALTSSGSLTRRPAKTTTGAAPSTGAMTRSNAKVLAATLASSGTLTKVKVALVTFTASLTSAGVLTRRPGKALTGTSSSGGTVSSVRAFVRAFTGAVSSTGVLARATSKGAAGSMASTGALTRVKVALIAVAGTLTSSATVTRRAGKALAGALTDTGQLTRQPRKAVAGASTSTGALTRTRLVILAVAGTVTSAGALTRRTSRALAGQLTSAGGLTRMARLVMTGAATSVGVVTAVVGGLEPWSWFLRRVGVLRKSTPTIDGHTTTTDVTP